MTMFPQLNESFYTDNDRTILQRMDYTYTRNITINQVFWAEADLDLRFKAGDQSLFNNLTAGGPAFRQRQYTFNRIRRSINMVSGYQRQHRKQTSCTPVHPRDEETADQFTKLFYHVNNTAHVPEIMSEAFEGGITCGMNLLATYLNFSLDPVNGDIQVDNTGHSSYLIDPYFKKMDLSDCNSLWTRKYLSRLQVKALLPSRKAEIEKMSGWGNKDGKFQFMAENYNFAQQDLLCYDEFWYLDTRSQLLLVDTETGETSEWRGKDEDLRDFLYLYPQIIEMNQTIPTVRLAIVVQGQVMYDGPNPLSIDRYPFVPVWAYYEPQISAFQWRCQGIVRGLRDAQALYTRSRLNMMDIQESQINSGWIYKENALVNPKDVFMTGMGKGLAIKGEAQITDVQRIDPPQIPPSMMQISEFLGDEINQISGINEELLGAAEDDKAGVLSMLRQGAGLTTLQVLFDNLDRAQKMLGDIHLEIIQANWTPGKVARILGEEPTQQFYNRSFGKFDSVVEEASLTATQRQQAFLQMLHLKELGIPVPTSSLLKNMNVSDKKELVEAIEATEKAQSEQAKRMEDAQWQSLMVDNETKLSYSEAEKGLAKERLNKINIDMAVAAERLNKSEVDKTQAVLNIVKAAKELEHLDADLLQKCVNLAMTIGEEQEDGGAKAKIEEMISKVDQDPLSKLQPPQSQQQQQIEPEANMGPSEPASMQSGQLGQM